MDLINRMIGVKRSPPQPNNTTPALRDLNFLLLGETGVGKSTFVNAFVNYINYENFNIAMESEPECLIPSKFTITDPQTGSPRTLTIGEEEENETLTVGASATQGTKGYIFNLGDDQHRIRFIDTPGIGDTRSIKQDEENFENILDSIGVYDQLHAICILMKPNQTRLTPSFQYCLSQLLTKLEKSAAQNMLFVFTNTRSTFYKVGETGPLLRKELLSIQSKPPFVAIPFGKDNTFCFDNEAFRCLIALKKGISYDDSDYEEFVKSWGKSVAECKRMIKYILDGKVVPHNIKNTISINDARRTILLLSKPLADITQSIQNNTQILNVHKDKVEKYKNEHKNLSSHLYVPCTKIRTIELPHPVTVCTSRTCTKVTMVEGVAKEDYCKKCHEHCYLTNVPKEIIGSPELMHCAAMGAGYICRICKCDYSKHMHIYYMTDSYEDRVEDQAVKTQIQKATTEKEKYEAFRANVEKLLKEYDEEHVTITKVAAKFASFLKENSIIVLSDAYEKYIKYLIEKEERLGHAGNKTLIRDYNNMLRLYQKEKEILDEAIKKKVSCTALTAEDISTNVENLFRLKHFGQQLKNLYENQLKGVKNAHFSNQEYIHSSRGVRKSFLDMPDPEVKVQKEKKTKKSNTDKNTVFSKTIRVNKNLLGLVIGKKGANIAAARAIEGIQSIIIKDNTINITATDNDALAKAEAMLDFVEHTFNIPTHTLSKFLENEGQVLENIINKTGIKSIKVFSEGDNDFKGARRPGFIPATLMGSRDSIGQAKKALLEKVNQWKSLKSDDQNPAVLHMTRVFQMNKKADYAIAEFLVRKDLMEYIYGENGGNLYKAYKNKDIIEINIDKDNGWISIKGKSEEVVEEARAILEYKEARISVPKEFVDKLGPSIKQLRDAANIRNLIMTPKGDIVILKCVGTNEKTAKFQKILQSLYIQKGYKGTLLMEYVDDHEDEEEVFHIPDGCKELVQIMKPQAEEINGIKEVIISENTVKVIGKTKEAVGQTKQFLVFQEKKFEVSRKVVSLLFAREDETYKILKMHNVASITVAGDSNPFGEYQTKLPITILGVPRHLAKIQTALTMLEYKNYDNIQILDYIPDRTFKYSDVANQNSPVTRDIRVPKHLIPLTFGKYYEKARNVPGVTGITFKDDVFTIEGENRKALEKACRLLEIVEETLEFPNAVESKITRNKDILKKKTDIIDIVDAGTHGDTLSEKMMKEMLVDRLSQKFVEDGAGSNLKSKETTVLSRAMVTHLLSENNMLIRIVLDVAELDEISIIGEGNDKLDLIYLLLSGYSSSLKKAKLLFEELKLKCNGSPEMPKIPSLNFRKSAPKDMNVYRIIGNVESITLAKSYLDMLKNHIVKFEVPTNVVELSLKNLNRAKTIQGIIDIKLTGNKFEIIADSETSASTARSILEFSEHILNIPLSFMPKLEKNKATFDRIIASNDCKYKSLLSSDFSNMQFHITGLKKDVEKVQVLMDDFMKRDGEPLRSLPLNFHNEKPAKSFFSDITSIRDNPAENLPGKSSESLLVNIDNVNDLMSKVDSTIKELKEFTVKESSASNFAEFDFLTNSSSEINNVPNSELLKSLMDEEEAPTKEPKNEDDDCQVQ